MKQCENCGYEVSKCSFTLLDYCLVCSKTLCDNCMKKGCCGNIPAKSGEDEDYSENGFGNEINQER